MASAKSKAICAENQLSRRNILAAPLMVAVAGAYAEGARAAEAVGLVQNFAEVETPVMALFREWKRIDAAFEAPGITEYEMDRLLVDRGAVNVKMNSTTSQTPLDVLMKIMVASEYGEYGRYDTVFDTGWDEARVLVGEAA